MTTNRLRSELARVWMLVLLAGVVAVPPARPQGKSPLAGDWNANVSKSRRHPNHLFKNARLQIEVSEDAVSITYSGVNMSGMEESGTTKLHPDGKEHPISEAPGVVEISKWLGAHILETVAKKDGQVVGQSTYEVSSDATTLTAKLKGSDASGASFEQVIVFDRQ